jgi:hypothetical protein
MSRYRSVFPHAKPVIYIGPGRPRRRTRMLSPILKLVVVASAALVVMASVMASGRAHEACAVVSSGESRTFDVEHQESCGQPPTTLAVSTPS